MADVDVFACRPCECGGMCDKCRQTERGQPSLEVGKRRSGERRGARLDPRRMNLRNQPTQPRSVCLCDPDTDAVCDRNCA